MTYLHGLDQKPSEKKNVRLIAAHKFLKEFVGPSQTVWYTKGEFFQPKGRVTPRSSILLMSEYKKRGTPASVSKENRVSSINHN